MADFIRWRQTPFHNICGSGRRNSGGEVCVITQNIYFYEIFFLSPINRQEGHQEEVQEAPQEEETSMALFLFSQRQLIQHTQTYYGVWLLVPFETFSNVCNRMVGFQDVASISFGFGVISFCFIACENRMIPISCFYHWQHTFLFQKICVHQMLLQSPKTYH